MEETLTNWELFKDFYVMIRDGSWSYLFAGQAFIAIIGILRFVWAYATASWIGSIEDNTISGYILEYVFYLTLMNNKEQERYEKNDRDLSVNGKHLGGVCIDFIAWSIIGLLMIFAWPVLLPIMILFVPLQMSHVYHKRRKTFIANLKGEQLDT